jgi:hypothetical protein
MSEQVTGSGAANEHVEGVAEDVKEVAGDAAENVKEFFSGDVAENAKELAGNVTENVKGFGARIAGLFKSGK